MPHQCNFDPYSTMATTPPISRVAIFYCGRCLSRIYWHLQQGFLLGFRFDSASNAGQIRNHKATHLTDGFQVVNTLATLVGVTQLQDSDTLSRDIRRSANEWKDGLEPDTFRDAIDQVTEEFQTQPEDVSPEGYCGQLVRNYVDALHGKLYELMTVAFQQHLGSIFNLGVQCERGICRPDVYRFLTWSNVWPVLSDGPQSSPPDTIEPEEEECHADAGMAREEVPTVRSLATRSFAPGQLAPEDGWIDDLRAAWTQAGLPDGDLHAKLLNLERQLNQRMLRQSDILGAADEIHGLACESILDRSPTVERIQVDLETYRIFVDGCCYGVKPHQAQMVDTLRKAAIDHSCWVPEPELLSLPGCRGKNFAREFKNLYLAVPTLESLIVSEKGNGRRLK